MQRKIYDAQRMATCQGLPRLMKKLGLLQKHKKTKIKVKKEPISLGSKIKYDMVCDQAFLERIIAACGRIVTPVEGVLTNEVLFQHVTKWSSALRAGLFQRKLPFTAPGKGAQKENVNNKIDKTKKSVAKSNAPYSVKHFVRKQALWLIRAHQDLGTCQVDYSQMTLEDLKRLMPDSSNSLSKVGLSHKATVFQVVEGMDPLVIATFLCLFLPLEKKPSHLSAITNPANHELALRLIKEYESRAGVPPPPSWLASELDRTNQNMEPVGGHQPLDLWMACASAKGLAQGETKEAVLGDHRPRDHQPPMATGSSVEATVKSKDAHGDLMMWHPTGEAPHKKLRCGCTGNCRRLCPGRGHGGCPNVAVINLPGKRQSLKKMWIQLCSVCRCQEPGCHGGARKPYGDHMDPCNWGRCARHWK